MENHNCGHMTSHLHFVSRSYLFYLQGINPLIMMNFLRRRLKKSLTLIPIAGLTWLTGSQTSFLSVPTKGEPTLIQVLSNPERLLCGVAMTTWG